MKKNMKNQTFKAIILFFVILSTGCAVTYKQINPKSLNYNATSHQKGIEISYKYDVLREKGNSRYAKKEIKKGVKLVAVKITNNTDSIINIGRDVIFYSGNNPISPMEPRVISSYLSQITPSYLPYLLLTFTNLYVSNGYTIESYPIGLILGPLITIGNVSVAASSNKAFLNELNKFNLINKDVNKGETVYGIIGVRDSGFNPIFLK